MAMQTRGRRQNYLALNDGYDSEAESEDRMPDTNCSTPSSPAENSGGPHQEPLEVNLDSQCPATSQLEVEELPARGLPLAGEVVLLEPVSDAITRSLKGSEKVNWLWSYFEIQEFQNEWVEKRSKKRRHTDRKFRCSVVVKATGKQCEWFTTDYKR
jgi:hypothetical protein